MCSDNRKSEMYIHCREKELQRYLKNAVREFHIDIRTSKLEKYIKKNLQMTINRRSISVHHEHAQKKKWKKVIHNALHQFAHHPINGTGKNDAAGNLRKWEMN